MNYSKKTIDTLKILQKGEIEASLIYKNLSKRSIDMNREVLTQISTDELSHYYTYKHYTNIEVKPNLFRINFFIFISYIFGITFTMKFLENVEKQNRDYSYLIDEIKEMEEILNKEKLHEQQLISMINEERLNYMSSIVLGLNDALVELTGALAGFTLSIQNSNTIALLGLITGISAALSMASSEYLSSKSETQDTKDSLISATYTGIAYLVTVFLLITPYFIFSNYLIALLSTIIIGIVIIAIFNLYMSVCNEDNFKHRFLEMAIISLTVTVISFIIGFLVKTYLGLDI